MNVTFATVRCFLFADLNCVKSCKNLPDGDYQSCRACNEYLTCADGFTYDFRSCPAGLVWDDDRKYCDWVSHTCDLDDKDEPAGGAGISLKAGIYSSRNNWQSSKAEQELTPLKKLLLRGPVK